MRRLRSRNQVSFSDKMVAVLRREFGGHSVRQAPSEALLFYESGTLGGDALEQLNRTRVEGAGTMS
ncbi:MAG: hypothetical protein K9N21_12055 [Deltaproteobacteria bacterium]|nr:hypothetical protein [Deltaproteobacteria bacterium]